MKGQASAAKRSGRSTSEGTVASYIHADGKVGVLVEVQCETDFVARNDDFQEFAREVAIHIAGSPNVPQYVSAEEIPEEAKEAERKVYAAKAAEEGKPEDIIQKIVDGQISKWSKDVALLEQEHIRTDMHEGKTIEELRQELAANTGENIRIARFARFQVGEEPARTPYAAAAVADPVFKRVLLKLSGEALMGSLEYGTDAERVDAIAHQVRDVAESGVEVAVVVGAGNIYRGLAGAAAGMDRATADYMGMLATVLNALTLQDALEKAGALHPGHVGDGGDRGRRALHPPARDPPPGEGPRRDLRRRHGQPVLHDRHGRGAARARDPRRRDPDGEARGGGRLRRRPEREPGRGPSCRS